MNVAGSLLEKIPGPFVVDELPKEPVHRQDKASQPSSLNPVVKGQKRVLDSIDKVDIEYPLIKRAKNIPPRVDPLLKYSLHSLGVSSKRVVEEVALPFSSNIPQQKSLHLIEKPIVLIPLNQPQPRSSRMLIPLPSSAKLKPVKPLKKISVKPLSNPKKIDQQKIQKHKWNYVETKVLLLLNEKTPKTSRKIAEILNRIFPSLEGVERTKGIVRSKLSALKQSREQVQWTDSALHIFKVVLLGSENQSWRTIVGDFILEMSVAKEKNSSFHDGKVEINFSLQDKAIELGVDSRKGLIQEITLLVDKLIVNEFDETAEKKLRSLANDDRCWKYVSNCVKSKKIIVSPQKNVESIGLKTEESEIESSDSSDSDDESLLIPSSSKRAAVSKS